MEAKILQDRLNIIHSEQQVISRNNNKSSILEYTCTELSKDNVEKDQCGLEQYYS